MRNGLLLIAFISTFLLQSPDDEALPIQGINRSCVNSSISIDTEILQRRAEDVHLSVITRHPSGGVLVGGSVYMGGKRQAVILRNDGERLDAVLVPEAPYIDALAFTTPVTGWRLDAGTLFGTNDLGTCWKKVLHSRKAISLHFVDVSNGWLVGNGGMILRTHDGGVTWHRQDGDTDYDLKNVFFIDRDNGWAIAQKAFGDYPPKWKTALIGTRDGGRTWEKLSGIFLRSFCFINSSEGWGINSQNDVVHTIDGGKMWSLQRSSSEAETWSSVSFVSRAEGWIVGDGILHTSDGGDSWQFQLPREPRQPTIEKVVFEDAWRGWALRSQQLLHTSDGGKTWKSIFQDRRLAEAGPEGPR